ncbi:hypothetical protein JCM13664_05550 [Methylothermus subterraneus]
MTEAEWQANIERFLREWPGLSQFCTQNGWIDDATIRYEIQALTEREAIVAVWFTEILMEGSGCVADRRECFGKLRLKCDGRALSAEPV